MAENISITRGLSELNSLSERIEKTIVTSKMFVIRKGSNSPVGFKSVVDFESKAKASAAKFNDLRRRYREIKRKIILSNAEVKIEIAKEEMTVAEAIEYKDSISFEKRYLESLKRNFSLKNIELEQRDMDVEERLDRLVEANFGKEGKVNKDAYEAIAAPFMKQNKWSAIDPISIQNVIENLSEKIMNFELEVDFVLSESNAKTEITID